MTRVGQRQAWKLSAPPQAAYSMRRIFLLLPAVLSSKAMQPSTAPSQALRSMALAFMTVIAPQVRSSGMQPQGSSAVQQIRTQVPPTVQARASLSLATPSASTEPSLEPCWISQPCQELSSTHVINSALPEHFSSQELPLLGPLSQSAALPTPSRVQMALPPVRF